MISRATLAIVRDHMRGRFWADVALGAAFGLAVTFVPRRGAGWYSDAVLVVAIGWGAFAGTRRVLRSELHDLAYFAAPLYGRQVARALAVGPVLNSLAAPVGGTIGLALHGALPNAALALVPFLAAAVAALVGLSSVVRDEGALTLYLVLAYLGGIAVALASFAAGRFGALAAAGMGAVIGYAALRAFGETLARFDPID